MNGREMRERVAAIVAAYVRHHAIAAAELPTLIASVDKVLSELAPEPAVVPAPLSPAVPIRRSLSPHAIVCLDCGWSGQMLRRHLTTAHGLTPEQYRERWKLPVTYPLVAANYSSRRSALAKALGLGTRRRAPI